MRTREVGIQEIHSREGGNDAASAATVRPDEVELLRRDYAANGGWETFLAFEDPRQDILVGLLRLRKLAGPDQTRQPGLQGRVSMVRELHVYGTAVAVHARHATNWQHQVRAWPCWPSQHTMRCCSWHRCIVRNVVGAIWIAKSVITYYILHT